MEPTTDTASRPFYELHAWVWKDNPAGSFVDYNSDASCQHASAMGGIHMG